MVLGFATHRAAAAGTVSRPAAWWVGAMLAALAAWGVLSSILAINGAYRSSWFISSWGGTWLPFVPVLLMMIPLMVSSAARQGVVALIDATPPHRLALFQGIRILAVGGLIKAWMGVFSAYFAIYVAIPDVLFGISALFMARMIRRKRVGTGVVALWHLLGAFIIVPVGVALIQLGMPGPVRIFTAMPSILTIFDFPMVLAPTLVVPIFVMLNLLTVLRIRAHGEIAGSGQAATA
jgi:hypothetical protein